MEMKTLIAATLALIAVVARSISGFEAEVQTPVAPQLLSETGLYAGAGTTQVDSRNRPFSPQYPLWSDGAAKKRWIRLPDGAAIDVSNVSRWEFPVGTKFWKEFSFDGRKVETRLLWRVSRERWVFASYAWNETQTDAALAPESGIPNVVEVAPGKRHSIPSVADCQSCHVSTRTEILGFDALQLSDDRDPNALHAETLAPGMITLQTLVDEGLMSPRRTELIATPPRIPAASPLTRTALGYLSTNCGSCHNTRSTLSDLGLVLRQPARGPVWTDADVAALLERTTKWQQPGASSRTVAMRPGVPEHSAILYRMRSRRPSSQMPPLGTVVSDQAALSLMTQWVSAMPAP